MQGAQSCPHEVQQPWLSSPGGCGKGGVRRSLAGGVHGRRSHGKEAFIYGRRAAKALVLYGRTLCQAATPFISAGGPSRSLRRTNGRTKRRTNGRLTWPLTAVPVAHTVAQSVATTRLRRSIASQARSVLCGKWPTLCGHPRRIRRRPNPFMAARIPPNNCYGLGGSSGWCGIVRGGSAGGRRGRLSRS